MSAMNRTGPLAGLRGRTFPIASFLDLLTLICALFSFMMTRDGIGPGTAWIFLAAFLLLRLVSRAGGIGVDIPRPPGFLVFGAAFCLLVPILMQIHRFRVAEPLLEAILLLIVVRDFDTRSSRDYVQMALLALSSVIIYALLTVERSFLAACMGVGYCSSLILMLSAWLRREPEARLSLSDAGRILARALGMFATMLPLCLLLFFLAPRVASPFLIRRNMGMWGATGFSDQIRLGQISSIQESGRLAFRAEMQDISPRTPYWRGVVLSYFDGSNWSVNLLGRSGGWRGGRSAGPVIRQSIMLEPGMHRWLFTLDRPLNVSGESASDMGNGTYTRYAFGAARYQAVSTLSPVPGELSGRDEQVYLQIPDGYSPRVWRLAGELTRGASTDRERMDAVASHLLGGEYRWTLRGLPEGPDALEDFLLSYRQGNCEYFASAAGVLLRMAGVPSRLVGGYKGGDYNGAGGYYAVRDHLAHVWVEAWDREDGTWVRLDPTPAALEGEGGAISEAGGAWVEFWDFIDFQWNRYFVAYDAREQSQWATALRDLLRNPRASAGRSRFSGLGSAFSRGALLVAALILACAGGWFLYRWGNRDPRVALLRRFERLMGRRGYVRRRSEGLEEFANRLPDSLRDRALDFAREFGAVWYGGRTLDEGRWRRLSEDLAELARAVRR